MKEAIDYLHDALKQIQEFFAKPRYLPEKHYMRGPGPACAAKAQVKRAPESR